MSHRDERETGGDEDKADVHLPASEADSPALREEREREPQSWPGSGFGSIPPPG